MTRLVIVSPIPPMRTGTARYIDLFLRDGSSILNRDNCLIVTGPQLRPAPQTHAGLDVTSWRNYEPSNEDVIIAFFANNEFHRFVYEVVGGCADTNQVISVIHDPQCFMNVEAMNRPRAHRFDVEGLRPHIECELPKLQSWILKNWQTRSLPLIMKYNLVAHSRVLQWSHALVVHSYYAALKISLESGHGVTVPEILVMQHPQDTYAKTLRSSEYPEKFIVGCFGWISPAKRPIAAIRGFADFLSNLPLQERKSVLLKFVGQVADASCDPLAWAERLGVQEHCVSLGHVPDDEFVNEMSTLSLLLNLRFPSCGETSGTLNLAEDLGISVAMSDYQAFREEKAHYHIRLTPDREVKDISAAIAEEYKKWSTGRGRQPRAVECRYEHLPRKLTPREIIASSLGGMQA